MLCIWWCLLYDDDVKIIQEKVIRISLSHCVYVCTCTIIKEPICYNTPLAINELVCLITLSDQRRLGICDYIRHLRWYITYNSYLICGCWKCLCMWGFVGTTRWTLGPTPTNKWFRCWDLKGIDSRMKHPYRKYWWPILISYILIFNLNWMIKGAFWTNCILWW